MNDRISPQFTLIFCLYQDEVLMLLRQKPPHKGCWNGLGGKIESGETAEVAMRRELFEEAQLTVKDEEVRYMGVVSWQQATPEAGPDGAMHCFTVRIADRSRVTAVQAKGEGRLAWHPLASVCDPENPRVVSNIHVFLPAMLASPTPLQFHCIYQEEVLEHIEQRMFTKEET